MIKGGPGERPARGSICPPNPSGVLLPCFRDVETVCEPQPAWEAENQRERGFQALIANPGIHLGFSVRKIKGKE